MAMADSYFPGVVERGVANLLDPQLEQALLERLGGVRFAVDESEALQARQGRLGVFHRKFWPAWAEKPPMVTTSALRV